MKEIDVRAQISQELKILANNQRRKGNQVFSIDMLYEIARRIRDNKTLISE